ncbi:MAG: PIN domain-containing protein [Thaumarchaeota archaeon]|nr:PIN domain-containing protein [Nitrososphaerota archaeon]
MRIALDTNVFVGVLNKEPSSADSRKILDRIDSGSLGGVVSTLVIAEMCAGYHMAGQTEEKDDFLTHLEASQSYEIVELSTGVADQAGRIKAETGLKLPDAIVVASAMKGGAEFLVSNDESLKKVAKFIRVLSSREFVDREEE